MTELTKLTAEQAKALENAQARADHAAAGGEARFSPPHRFRGNAVHRMIDRLKSAGLIMHEYQEGAGHITDKGRQALAAHQAKVAAIAARKAELAARPVVPARLDRFTDLAVARADLAHPFVQGVARWFDGSDSRFTWSSDPTNTDPLTIYRAGDGGGSHRVRILDNPAPAKVAAILGAIEAAAWPLIDAAKADHDVIEAERARRNEARMAWHHQRDAGPDLARALQAIVEHLTASASVGKFALADAQAALAASRGEGLQRFDVSAPGLQYAETVTAPNAAAARDKFAYAGSYARGYSDGPLPVRPVDVVATPVAG